MLLNVAQTSLRTKIHVGVADVLAPIVVDAVLSIKAAGGDIDLHMVRCIHLTCLVWSSLVDFI